MHITWCLPRVAAAANVVALQLREIVLIVDSGGATVDGAMVQVEKFAPVVKFSRAVCVPESKIALLDRNVCQLMITDRRSGSTLIDSSVRHYLTKTLTRKRSQWSEFYEDKSVDSVVAGLMVEVEKHKRLTDCQDSNTWTWAFHIPGLKKDRSHGILRDNHLTIPKLVSTYLWIDYQ